MNHIRVLLADDHTLVRAGIRSLLEDLADVEVVGEAGEGIETLRLVGALRPDILLLDIGMPGLNGLEVMRRALALHDRVRVVILSMHSNEEYVVQALRGGAAGYLLKGSSAVELELAIRSVANGGSYLSPAVSKRVVDEYVHRTAGDDPLAGLTPRQREVLQLVAERHSSKEIAKKLGLSTKTVENHRAQIMDRLRIHDLAGLVLFAVRVGLVTPNG